MENCCASCAKYNARTGEVNQEVQRQLFRRNGGYMDFLIPFVQSHRIRVENLM